MPTMVINDITMDDSDSPSLSDVHSTSSKSSDMRSSPLESVRIGMKMGPNEQRYFENLDAFVISILKDEDVDRTPTYPKYNLLSQEEKDRLLNEVDDLLCRLEIKVEIDVPKYEPINFNDSCFELDFTKYLDLEQHADTSTTMTTTLNEGSLHDATLTSNDHSVSLLFDDDDEDEDEDEQPQPSQWISKNGCTSPTYKQKSHTNISQPPQLRDITQQNQNVAPTLRNSTYSKQVGSSRPSISKISKPSKRHHKASLKLHMNQNSSTVDGIDKSFEGLMLDDEVSSNEEELTDPEESSIEQFRGTSMIRMSRSTFQMSPPLLPNNSNSRSFHKRVATTSGKKGADVQRFKREAIADLTRTMNSNGKNLHPNIEIPSHDAILEIAPSPLHSEGYISQSLPFLDSQSPIAPHPNASQMDIVSPMFSTVRKDHPPEKDKSFSIRRTLQFEHYVNSKHKQSNDTIEVFMSEAQAPSRPGKNSFQVSHHLKKGASFRMEPLNVQRLSKSNCKKSRKAQTSQTFQTSKSIPNEDTNGGNPHNHKTFPDPFSIFSKRTSHRLQTIVSFCQNQTRKSLDYTNTNDNSSDDTLNPVDSSHKGIILSLSESQIQAVVLKCSMANPPSYTRGCTSTSTSFPNGGILLVMREKEELKRWESYLREQSAFSVWNHASLTAAERRSTAKSQYSGFDIVLTTFDALKAKEQTLALNENGHVIRGNQNHHGWHTSDHSRTCKQLSMLHHIVWRQIVYIDVLGKKCFLSKDSTARMLACKALHAQSRFIFFSKNNNEANTYLELAHNFKENIKQLRVVAKVLHLTESRAAETIVGHAMIDFSQINGNPSSDSDNDSDNESGSKSDSNVTLTLDDSENLESPYSVDIP